MRHIHMCKDHAVRYESLNHIVFLCRPCIYRISRYTSAHKRTHAMWLPFKRTVAPSLDAMCFLRFLWLDYVVDFIVYFWPAHITECDARNKHLEKYHINKFLPEKTAQTRPSQLPNNFGWAKPEHHPLITELYDVY